VGRVLEAWNVGADAVVFVDDNALEREEVNRAFPTMRCLEYPTKDDDRLLELLATVHADFAKTTIGEEDHLRLASLRVAHERAASAPAVSPEELLADVDAQITFELGVCDQRTVDLLNKTNQFNLNGRRIDQSVKAKRAVAPGEFLLGVSYRDKFGPLGKIAVVHGRSYETEAEIDFWVMSCRAFSRRIEHHTLHWLFERTGAVSLRFDFVPTERNGVLRDFLAPIAEQTDDGTMSVARETFTSLCPTLYASVDVR
jgi:FkbH-like protein